MGGGIDDIYRSVRSLGAPRARPVRLQRDGVPARRELYGHYVIDYPATIGRDLGDGLAVDQHAHWRVGHVHAGEAAPAAHPGDLGDDRA